MTVNTKKPYSGDCRACSRHIRLWLPTDLIKPGADGRRIRCAKCGTTNWCRADQDPANIE